VAAGSALGVGAAAGFWLEDDVSGNVPGSEGEEFDGTGSADPGKGVGLSAPGTVGGVRYDDGPFELVGCGSGNCSGILGAGPCPSRSDGIEGVVSLGSTGGAGNEP